MISNKKFLNFLIKNYKVIILLIVATIGSLWNDTDFKKTKKPEKKIVYNNIKEIFLKELLKLKQVPRILEIKDLKILEDKITFQAILEINKFITFKNFEWVIKNNKIIANV